MKFTRRQRQANENSEILIQKLLESIEEKDGITSKKYTIKSTKDMYHLAQKLENELIIEAKKLEPDWAIPIIVEMVSKLYYGDYKEYENLGPCIKRALVYLYKNVFVEHGSEKSITSLLNIIKKSYLVETLYNLRMCFALNEDYSFYVINGTAYIEPQYEDEFMLYQELMSGRGRRLRTAQTNNALLSKLSEFVPTIIRILQGSNPCDQELLQGTFYEYIPGIEQIECKQFWQELLVRVVTYQECLISTVTKSLANDIELKPEFKSEYFTDCILFHEFALSLPDAIIAQENIYNIFWTKDWVLKQMPETYSNLIVSRPILRLDLEGDFATTVAILGDAINYFVENQIFQYKDRISSCRLPQDVFRLAFATAFEKEVAAYLGQFGFVAGNVTEDGIWKTQYGNKQLNNDALKLYGEVDVLAVNFKHGYGFVIECKVLADARDEKLLRNIIGKLSDEDTDEFRTKTIKKAEWIQGASSREFTLRNTFFKSFLLTDLPLPVVNDDYEKEDILYSYFEEFKDYIVRLTNEFNDTSMKEE